MGNRRDKFYKDASIFSDGACDWVSTAVVVALAACKRTQQLPTLLRQQCWELLVRVSSGVQTDATTPNNVGICSASWEGYNP